MLIDWCDLEVQDVKKDGGGLAIQFKQGGGVSVFNRYTFSGANIELLKGTKVTSFEETNDWIQFVFDERFVLIVGLKDDDYSGPEAMFFSNESVLPPLFVVWQ